MVEYFTLMIPAIFNWIHILKNLTSYAINYLKKELKTHIIIPVPDQEDDTIKDLQHLTKADENRKLTLKEKYLQIEQMLLDGDCKTQICRNLNMDVRVYDKLINKKVTVPVT